jgi:predicted transcriptional regulator of viral defense system
MMQTPPIDRQVAVLAGRQHSVIDCTQLRALGVRRGGVAYRVRRGRLHPMHRGVYAVGHSVVGREGRWMAAVLAVGPGAVLSHRSAAALLGLRDSSRSAIDVTTPHKAHSRDGIEVHRTSHLPREDVTRIRGIPCTTVPRTLIDLAEFLTHHEIERVLERAEINRQFDLRAVTDAIRRHRTRTGAATLRRVLDGYDETDAVRTDRARAAIPGPMHALRAAATPAQCADLAPRRWDRDGRRTVASASAWSSRPTVVRLTTRTLPSSAIVTATPS